MSAKVEPTTKQVVQPVAEKPRRVPLSKLTGQQVKARIEELDAEINDLVERTIKNLAPGRGFDRNLIRQMNKAQREKNRIVASRFISLLDIGHPEAKELLNRLMQIPA
ncbi:hypothetical protein [Dechloromonas sp. A34]|uniref:hypothetical protein n=1 Tax=Dechloromonas sp. A34 TaxID=447588 RepID=UPI002248DAF9|nr:hypothetical protein [Dechloromonas sp. A34]